MFLGPVWLYCVSAWGWLLAKCSGNSAVLVFACWLNWGVFNPLCSRDPCLVLRFSSCRQSSLGVAFCSFSGAVKGVPKTFPVTPLCRTKQWQPVPELKAVTSLWCREKGEQWLWFKPSTAGGVGPELSPPGRSRWWGLIKKSSSLLCFIIPECLENSGAV